MVSMVKIMKTIIYANCWDFMKMSLSNFNTIMQICLRSAVRMFNGSLHSVDT